MGYATAAFKRESSVKVAKEATQMGEANFTTATNGARNGKQEARLRRASN